MAMATDSATSQGSCAIPAFSPQSRDSLTALVVAIIGDFRGNAKGLAGVSRKLASVPARRHFVKEGSIHAAIRAARPAFGALDARIKQKILSPIDESSNNQVTKN
jgi:hypothetical protein